MAGLLQDHHSCHPLAHLGRPNLAHSNLQTGTLSQALACQEAWFGEWPGPPAVSLCCSM